MSTGGGMWVLYAVARFLYLVRYSLIATSNTSQWKSTSPLLYSPPTRLHYCQFDGGAQGIRVASSSPPSLVIIPSCPVLSCPVLGLVRFADLPEFALHVEGTREWNLGKAAHRGEICAICCLSLSILPHSFLCYLTLGLLLCLPRV